MSMAWKPPTLTGRRSTDISGLLFLSIVAIAVFSALWEKRSRDAHDSTLIPGEPLPVYDAFSHDGSVVSMEMFRGRVVLLTFWTRQCTACVDQFESMQALGDDLGDDGLEVVSVNLEETDRVLVRSYLDALGYDWANLFDDPSHVNEVFAWGKLIPKTILLNRDGTVGVWWRGKVDLASAENRAIIHEAMSIPGAPGPGG